jgi:uncharacterized integral membrane protein
MQSVTRATARRNSSLVLTILLIFIVINTSHALIGFKSHSIYNMPTRVTSKTRSNYLAIPIPEISVTTTYKAQCDTACRFMYLTDQQLSLFEKDEDFERIHEHVELNPNTIVTHKIETNGQSFDVRYSGRVHLVIQPNIMDTNITGMYWYGVDVQVHWVPVTYIVLIILVVVLGVLSSVLFILYIQKKYELKDEKQTLLKKDPVPVSIQSYA